MPQSSYLKKSTERIVHNCEKQKIDPLKLSECLIFSYIFDAWQCKSAFNGKFKIISCI